MARFLVILCLFVTAGCAGIDKAGKTAREEAPGPEGLVLVRDAPSIRTVQLHPFDSESALPVVQMGSGLKLRLAFDLMELGGRSLSIFFYHADRNWKQDLVPAEYLTVFHRDDILDYHSSRAVFTPYVHYEYLFPNNSIDFTLSGNYILRVSEQGREDEPLFERPFFVSEQSTPIDMRLDNIMIAGRQRTSVQPFVRFRPPSINTNVFDYRVCFVRNFRISQSRCVDNPSLEVQPDLAYYLEPSMSFATVASSYLLDLTDIRPGGRIEGVDQKSIPWRVFLEPDFARFPGNILGPFLNGQSAVRSVVRSVVEPDFNSEYISVTFRFVPPDGIRAEGRVLVTGSFNNWKVDSAKELSWNEMEGWYEGQVTVKQGLHEYTYIAQDPRITSVMNSGLPQIPNLYTSFVYFDDITRQTDRLIAVQGMIVE